MHTTQIDIYLYDITIIGTRLNEISVPEFLINEINKIQQELPTNIKLETDIQSNI